MQEEKKIDLSELNVAQNEAVRQINGPSLIIAGAGSGKTKVLTFKIAYILEQGISPSSVLALTFTNKAAKEMKIRIAALVGPHKARNLYMGTFHSIFIRFLRTYSDLIGFPSSFTIYDTTDSKSLIKACIKELELDDKVYKPNEVYNRISNAKNSLVTAQAYINNPKAIKTDQEHRKGRICDIYSLYSKKCFQSGVMDFDDILLYMNILLRDNPQVTEELQKRFKYILVDEYQDTNVAQYYIVKKLSAVHKNITVVGDDSQSIYSFRGAKIQNILNFSKDYPNAKQYKLEQNYRSTQTIVLAANSLIKKNHQGLRKDCFSKSEKGEKIELLQAYTEQDEAAKVASSIASRLYSAHASYDEFAILYRTNAQSRVVEEMLRKHNFPYKIHAGHSFYDRAEVKDVMAYFRLLVNPKDDEAFKRVVNVPARGIGKTTIARLADAAQKNDIALIEALRLDNLSEYGLRDAVVNKLRLFAQMVAMSAQQIEEKDASEAANAIINASGYVTALKNETSIEAKTRLENVEELLSSVDEYVEAEENLDENGEEISEAVKVDENNKPLEQEVKVKNMSSFLENVALLTEDTDDETEDENKITLMTVHAAKGLEFPYVYIIGMEENLFPSKMSIESESQVEEERRLFYVALTRAEKAVSLSYSKSRFRFGQHVNYPVSRFLREIDPKYIDGELEESNAVNDDTYGNTSSSYENGRGSSFGRAHNSYSSRRDDTFGNRGSNAYSRKGTTFSSKSTSKSTNRPTPSFSRPVQNISTNFVPSSAESLSVGQRVEHNRFGKGVIKKIEGNGAGRKAVVSFDLGGDKTLLLKYAKLMIL